MKKILIIPVLIRFSILCQAQAESADELAQKMQNPLASLIAVPIQQNFAFGASQNKKLGYSVSFQPIFPINYKRINIINRVIFGYGYVPGIVEGTQLIPQGAPENGNVDGKWGLSDLNYSFYFSPKTTYKVAWGLGPSVNMPTATDNRLGTGKWSIGPSMVIVIQIQKWTFDMVFRQTWSIGGDGERRDVNQFVLQPLIAYGIGKGFVLSTFPTITANWDFEESQRWTVPLGGGLSKVVFLGKLPIVLALQYYKYQVRPDLAPESELRFTSTFILSK
jgi:hypothetical protein